jgi:hypothetical protein
MVQALPQRTRAKRVVFLRVASKLEEPEESEYSGRLWW